MQPPISCLLFSGTSNPQLAQEIAELLGIKLGSVEIRAFPDSEIGVQIFENVRGKDVFVLQSIARRPNHYLMELLLLIDALKRASARSITAVIPYYGYARQDRKDKPRVPITAKLIADLLEKAGASRVLTMDLHAEQIQGFFNIPVDNLHARTILSHSAQKLGFSNGVVVAPDIGSVKLAKGFATILDWDFAVIDKRRISAETVEMSALIGDVKGKEVLLVDDMCSTGETLKKAVTLCKKAGATRVCGAVTHALFNEPQFEESAMEKLLVCDTIALPKSLESDSKLQVVSVADLFSKAIQAILTAKSISCLFD